MGGADLIAVNKSRYFQKGSNLSLGTEFFFFWPKTCNRENILIYAMLVNQEPEHLLLVWNFRQIVKLLLWANQAKHSLNLVGVMTNTFNKIFLLCNRTYHLLIAAARFTGNIPLDEILMVGDDVRDDVIGKYFPKWIKW